MKQETITNLKRYVISSLITFISTFLLVLLPILGDISLTKSSLIAGVVTATRLGIKAVVEYILPILQNKLK